MELSLRDVNLILAGLKAVSNDDAYSSDDKRRAKDLEDKLGCDFSAGCEVSKRRVSPS